MLPPYSNTTRRHSSEDIDLKLHRRETSDLADEGSMDKRIREVYE
jgi:hypothetical protein